MMTVDKKFPNSKSGCPINQMTFGEIVRYLQGGYEPPVQRAIASHVQFCNACAAELERVKALRKVGRHLMDEHLADFASEDATEAAPHLEPALLAAFADHALSSEEVEKVVNHLSSCHACYQQFAALSHEIERPVPARFKTPEEVVASMLAPEPASAVDLGAPFREIWNRVTAWSERVLGGAWRAPAAALALGLLVLLAILPNLHHANVISLQAVQQAIANPDQVVSGNMPGVTLRNDVLVIGPEVGEEVIFTWPAVEERPVSNYRVGLYDSENRKVVEEDVTETRWVIPVSIFAPGERYTINVVAFYEGGGVRPVIRGQKIERAE